jgi:hypothetical protein
MASPARRPRSCRPSVWPPSSLRAGQNADEICVALRRISAIADHRDQEVEEVAVPEVKMDWADVAELPCTTDTVTTIADYGWWSQLGGRWLIRFWLRIAVRRRR